MRWFLFRSRQNVSSLGYSVKSGRKDRWMPKNFKDQLSHNSTPPEIQLSLLYLFTFSQEFTFSVWIETRTYMYEDSCKEQEQHSTSRKNEWNTPPPPSVWVWVLMDSIEFSRLYILHPEGSRRQYALRICSYTKQISRFCREGIAKSNRLGLAPCCTKTRTNLQSYGASR